MRRSRVSHILKKEELFMFNPKDIELLDTEEGRAQLDPDFVAEFTDTKGDDEDGSKPNVQQ